MSAAYTELARPPIREAVLDFDCDVPPSIRLEALEEPAKAAFAEHYPNVQPRYLQEVQVTSGEGAFNSSLQRSLQAWMFLQQDGKQLVQVRQSGFSFNRLAPYAGFDTYLPEIRRTWDLYRGFVSPLSVRTLRLRYLNRIILPLAGGGVELDHYLTIQPALPAGDQFTLSGFLNQYTAMDRRTGHQVAVVVTAQSPEGSNLPILFDNAAAATGEWDPADWCGLERVLRSLRDLKNEIFFNTLKQPCMELFT